MKSMDYFVKEILIPFKFLVEFLGDQMFSNLDKVSVRLVESFHQSCQILGSPCGLFQPHTAIVESLLNVSANKQLGCHMKSTDYFVKEILIPFKFKGAFWSNFQVTKCSITWTKFPSVYLNLFTKVVKFQALPMGCSSPIKPLQNPC